MNVEVFRRGVSDYLDGFTERWIGWTFPPVERAIADSGWSADEPAAYCSRCGDSVGPGEATPQGCGTCRDGAELSGGIADGVVRLGTYTDSLRQWVRNIKYDRWTEMGNHLGRLLAQRIRDLKLVDPDRIVVVPMPMPLVRRMYRGIDHASLIASAVARELRAPMRKALARSSVPPQVGMSPSDRRRNGAKGLRVRRRIIGQPCENAHVVFIDDVRTTGATLKGATRLLKTLKPERVICGVLAVSDSTARRVRSQGRGDVSSWSALRSNRA